MRGAQLAAYLKTLPANIVERIEVIPNPSAKYDPEGMAGIINIVLKPNVDLGLSGGVNARRRERATATTRSGNLGYQSGPWTTVRQPTASTPTSATSIGHQRSRALRCAQRAAVVHQPGHRSARRRQQRPQPHRERRLQARRARRALERAARSTTARPTTTSLTAYTRARRRRRRCSTGTTASATTTSNGSMFDYTLAFKRTFEPRKHELSAEVRFNRAHDDDDTDLWRQPLSGGRRRRRIDGEIDGTDARDASSSRRRSTTRGRSPRRTKLETGYKGTARWLDRDYVVTQGRARQRHAGCRAA